MRSIDAFVFDGNFNAEEANSLVEALRNLPDNFVNFKEKIGKNCISVGLSGNNTYSMRPSKKAVSFINIPEKCRVHISDEKVIFNYNSVNYEILPFTD